MSLFLGLVTGSIVGCAVFIVLLLLRPITMKVFSNSWHYYCLIVPIVFLLGGTHIAVSLLGLMPYPSIRTASLAPIAHEIALTSPHNAINMPTFYNAVDTQVLGGEMIIDSETQQSITNQLLTHLEIAAPFLLTIWLFGVITFLTVSINRYLKYRLTILHNAKIVIDVNYKLPIAVSTLAHTPMLLGVIKPIIILPNIPFSDIALEMILAHEMVHYRRKDLFVKWLMLIANAIHWFNPAVYALNRQLDKVCELSCDERIVQSMDMQNRRLYGETILQILEHSTTQRNFIENVALATNLCNSKKNFKRRLISMMKAKKMKKSIAVLALTAGILVAGSGFVLSNTVNLAPPVSAYASETASDNSNEDTRLTRPTSAYTRASTLDHANESIERNITREEALQMGIEAIYDAFGTAVNADDIDLTYHEAHGAILGRGNMGQGIREWQDNILNDWQETLGKTIDEILDYVRELSERELTFEIGLAPYSIATPVGLTTFEFMDIINNVYIENRSAAVVAGWAAELGMTVDELYAHVWPPMPSSRDEFVPLSEAELEYYASRLNMTAERLGVPADDFNFVLGAVWNVVLSQWEMPAQPSMWHGNITEESAYFPTYSFTINAETGEFMFLNYFPDAALMGRDVIIAVDN